MTATAPADFTELYERYFEYAKKLLAKQGVIEVEDVAQDILMRFYERGMLDMFQPGYESHYHAARGKRVAVSFDSFLSQIICRYAMGKREREQKRMTNQAILLVNSPAGGATGGHSNSDTEWIDIYGPVTFMTVEEELEGESFGNELQAFLDTLPVKGKRDLAQLYRMVRAQVEQGAAKPDRVALAEAFEVTTTSIGNMINDLRKAIAEYMGIAVPGAPQPLPAWL